MSMDKRLKKPRPKPKAVGKKELEILAAVNDLRFVTRKGIWRLLYPSGSYTHAGEALRRLSGGAGFLSRFGLLPNALERIYTLNRQGAALLREQGAQADWWYSPQKASRYGSYSFLIHQLSLGKFLIALHAFARESPGYQVIEIRTCYELERQPPRLPFVEYGRGGASAVIPDAWAHIELPDGRRSALWIEIDNGTESEAKFQQLLLDRINLVRDKGYETFFGTPSLICCYLAVGPTTDYRLGRLRAMRRWTAKVLQKQKLDDWASVFKFSTIDECIFDTHMHFTDPVWTSADSDTLVSLFTPTQEQEEDDGPQDAPDC